MQEKMAKTEFRRYVMDNGYDPMEEERNGQNEYKERKAARRFERRKRKRRELLFKTVILLTILTILLITGALLQKIIGERKTQSAFKQNPKVMKIVEDAPEFDVQLLDVNEYSRPGQPMDKVTGIVIHYTANPGTTAQQNRDYFQGLKDSKETYASSHFVVGIDGEIIQCIPCNEIAYASNDRNADTVSIECCIPDETGEFSEAAYQSLVHLTAWLLGRYSLEPKDVIRHYDVTGKMCPKYYVENGDAWTDFLQDVEDYIKKNGVKQTK